jgi:hypothetical protein
MLVGQLALMRAHIHTDGDCGTVWTNRRWHRAHVENLIVFTAGVAEMSAILGSSGPLIIWQVMAALLLTSAIPSQEVPF